MASYNVEMQMLNGSGTYDTIYPQGVLGKMKQEIVNPTSTQQNKTFLKVYTLTYTSGQDYSSSSIKEDNSFTGQIDNYTLYRTYSDNLYRVLPNNGYYYYLEFDNCRFEATIKGSFLKSKPYFISLGANINYSQQIYYPNTNLIGCTAQIDNVYLSSNNLFKVGTIEPIGNYANWGSFFKFTPYVDLPDKNWEIIIEFYWYGYTGPRNEWINYV